MRKSSSSRFPWFREPELFNCSRADAEREGMGSVLTDPSLSAASRAKFPRCSPRRGGVWAYPGTQARKSNNGAN